ncbi:unnamed protein product [Arabidopsis thaliana]|uniref:Uncharacterized protein n=4 Tax=Arabidopsis TaxID=3701 RepID=B3H4W2_ARATH|nr:uncharacterized protein AT4G01516 [Arabidopsis thaliana]AEE82035.1 hypothetical protein AT4G01516 [Arabidopsis thaliana]KAG7614770.1 hypothetical protein ISN45_At04g001800 [Arabidopsis thaliana x Arabidopsis arenosa]KAG7619265.1 hypothetical protein ISN44_As04g001790 [Arabidopsis suecica]VYS61504.1 unnamed protein product [Arabidopsis thaliana]|eukprot:NP_001118911.1 hypothetical protein AT4G01516 [Arabidopsis thaliana]
MGSSPHNLRFGKTQGWAGAELNGGQGGQRTP